MLDDDSFKHQVRISRLQFCYLLGAKYLLQFLSLRYILVENDPVFRTSTKKQIPTEKQSAMAMWRFGNCGTGASYGQIGHMFGIGKCGTIINITRRVVLAILNLEKMFLSWPGKSEREHLASLMEEDFPNCIGFVDGTHVNLEEAPAVENPEDYFSRKQRYGLQLQVICDFNHIIRHVKIGHTASAHDARVFATCALAKNPDLYFSQDEWIAGDAAYKLTTHLVTPFRKNATLGTSYQRKQFNYEFSKNRVKIEQVYGFMKEKFSSLKELRVRISTGADHKFACQWIQACCVLYNIIRRDEDITEFFPLLESGDDESLPLWLEDPSGEEKREGLLKRFYNL